MTAPDQTLQPEPRLSMMAVTIELQGDTRASAEEDVHRISWYTGAPATRFIREADGSIEARLGDSLLVIARDRARLTRILRRNPALARNDIRDCCRMMAVVLEETPKTVEMLIIRVQAMAAQRPELSGSTRGTGLESNALATAVSHGGVRVPVWHRLIPNHHDPLAGELFHFTLNYDATAAVITEQNPSEELMVDIALALVDEMDRRVSRTMVDDAMIDDAQDEDPKPLTTLADPEYFANLIRSFPAWDCDGKADGLFVVVDALAVGYLTTPDGALELTMAELRGLARGYEDFFTGRQGAPQGTEDLDQRSIELLRQIRRHNWPSEDNTFGPQ